MNSIGEADAAVAGAGAGAGRSRQTHRLVSRRERDPQSKSMKSTERGETGIEDEFGSRR